MSQVTRLAGSAARSASHSDRQVTTRRVRWVGFQDLVVAPQVAVRRVVADRRAGLGGRVDSGAVKVLAGEFRLRDGVPDLLRGRPNDDLVHLHRVDLARGGHRAFSKLLLSWVSADTRRSVYLSIQRSWINRMGTGFR